jgi:uncharacterized protein YcfL
MKKLLCVVLAAFFLFGIFGVGAFADNPSAPTIYAVYNKQDSTPRDVSAGSNVLPFGTLLYAAISADEVCVSSNEAVLRTLTTFTDASSGICYTQLLAVNLGSSTLTISDTQGNAKTASFSVIASTFSQNVTVGKYFYVDFDSDGYNPNIEISDMTMVRIRASSSVIRIAPTRSGALAVATKAYARMTAATVYNAVPARWYEAVWFWILEIFEWIAEIILPPTFS